MARITTDRSPTYGELFMANRRLQSQLSEIQKHAWGLEGRIAYLERHPMQAAVEWAATHRRELFEILKAWDAEHPVDAMVPRIDRDPPEIDWSGRKADAEIVDAEIVDAELT